MLFYMSIFSFSENGICGSCVVLVLHNFWKEEKMLICIGTVMLRVQTWIRIALMYKYMLGRNNIYSSLNLYKHGVPSFTSSFCV